MGKGYLIIQLSSDLEALPVTNAKIKILDTSSEKIVFQSSNAVNRSGRTEEIELSAPNKELTLKPLAKGELPYGRYNIYISAVGYEDVNIEGVSIFDGIKSIQKVSMTSNKKENSFKKMPNNIFIPPHQLVLDEKREFQKGINDMSVSSKVLSKVYIPEYITVHLGTPTSYAEDITVKFIDYIKNVGSSEIYPTWPRESIKANVYAQISFALNRVYTEWYRNKGYPFQITNSTAYDQYFVYGREIFNSISEIVDEIFNEYVSIVSNEVPYFTQYCNGTTSICDGLLQWGTVDLAEQNHDALYILQFYYGSDKVIKITSIIEGIPSSYPGYVLRVGDNNENIKIIQEQLNRISKNYPDIPKIENPNGYFGEDTKIAVKTFQKIFNLSNDGIVGKGTWYKISEIYVAVKRLAELNQEADESGDFNGVYPGYILKYGARGEKIVELQSYLRNIAKYYNISTLSVDGIFGNVTLSSVKEFQEEFGLVPDGLVGPLTWNKIYDIYTSLPESAEFDGSFPGFSLEKGERGDKVLELQSYLKLISSYYDMPDVDNDGIIGEKTIAAIKNFQRKFNLKDSGIVNLNTWNKIYEVYSELPEFKNIEELSSYPGYVLKIGMKNEDVKKLQTMLNNIQKRYSNSNKVDVNGVFNNETKKLLNLFQKNFGLVESDMVDINTWRNIVSIYKELILNENINEPVIYKYPDKEIKLNDINAYVGLLKEYMNIFSKNNYPVDMLKINFTFDKKLQNNIKKFQKISGLNVTGIVDKATWDKISSTYEILYTGKEDRKNRLYKKVKHHK